jgi:hypothetical protein
MCLKFKEKIRNIVAQVDLINDDFRVVLELTLFTSNIKREICGVFKSFFFLEKYI